MAKHIIPMFLKKCGFEDIKKMETALIYYWPNDIFNKVKGVH